MGQEFEPISNLWGRFVDVMSSSGLSPQANVDAATARGDDEQQLDNRDAKTMAASAGTDDMEDTLPPGVAPGGGLVYGRQDRS